MNLGNITLSEINQTKKKDKYHMIPLKIGKFIEIESKKNKDDLSRRGNEELLLNGYIDPVWDDAKVLKIKSGQVIYIVNVLNADEMCSQNGSNGTFLLCIFYHNKENNHAKHLA